ncbi:hypothetical protein [Apilactobacillus apinorum]|uniref:hypothetical protein n=1 Tax=Apilactobacillus apinorum TaxID=1218495 RepID=UPI0006B66829|nr:hypothetical protein [Apilactobacillus apinorum]KOY69002.1 hypothetical protein RZ74_08020 [Apilactobacillus apinorum]CAI2679452.1 Hypothetical protein AAPFHON13_08520 [Apilactobacillus apinorum]
MALKTMSDVKIHLKLSKMQLTNYKQSVAVLTSGNDDKAHIDVFGISDDVSTKFDETTSVYKLVEKAFEVPDFRGVVEVISAPQNDVAKTANASATPTSSGASVSTSDTNRYVYALSQAVNDGFNYVVTDNLAEKDLEAVSDYLYNTQNALLVAQLNSVEAFNNLQAYSSQNQPMTSTKLNPVYAIVQTDGHLPNIQVATYATMNAPIDLMKIGNLSEFVEDPNLAQEDIDAINAKNGSVVIDKADDMMMLSGMTFGSNWADEFINTKIVKDAFQYDLQKLLNNNKHMHLDDAGINLLYQNAKMTAQRLYSEGYLDTQTDVNKKSFAETSDIEKSTRTYNGLSIEATVMSSIESINVTLDLVE